MTRFILILGFFIILMSCKSFQTNPPSDLLKPNESKNLYAFIGKKISVTEFDPNNPRNVRIEVDSITKDTLRHERYVKDNGFNCKYVVEKNLFNEIKTDTIEFKAYDHYGRPGFENYDRVVLYLSKDENGKYFHRKYQFETLYLNSKKEYYSYPKFLGNNYLQVANQLKSFKIEFPKNEKYDVSNIETMGISSYYPTYYYRIEEQFAYPIRGMFLDEIIEFRLKTTFKDL